MRARPDDLFQPTRPGPATWGLTALCSIVWIAAGPFELFDAQAWRLQFTAVDVWTGDPAGLLASAFFHANILHLLLNLLTLVYIGALLEKRVGAAQFFLIFAVTAVYGNTISLLLCERPTTPSLGASGGCFGILGAYVTAAFLTLGSKRVLAPLSSNAPVLTVLTGMVLAESIMLLGPGAQSMINHAAHLGGLLGGIGIAVLLHPSRKGTPRRIHPFLKIVVALFLLETGLYGAFPVASPLFNEQLALLALDDAEYRRADRFAEQALSLSGNRPGAHVVRGSAADVLGRVDEALDHLLKAEELVPSGNVMVVLAEFYREREMEGEAAEAFRTAEERLLLEIRAVQKVRLPAARPVEANLRNALAWLYAVFDHELDGAGQLATRALEVQPEDPMALGTLGVIRYKQGDLAGAIENLERAIENHTQRRPEAHDLYYLAMALHRSGRRQEAMRTLEEAVALDPLAAIRGRAEATLAEESREP